MSRSLSMPLGCLLPLLVLLGCGGAAGNVVDDAVPRASEAPVTVTITDENVHEKERALWRMDPDDPSRLALRDALLAYHTGASSEMLARGDYDEIVRELAHLVRFLTASDLDAGRVPQALAPLAGWVAEQARDRDDPGRAMGALFLLAAADPGASATHQAERDRIAATVRVPTEEPVDEDRIGALFEVWQRHEGLVPTSDAIAAITRLFVAKRDASQSDPPSPERNRILRTVFVYLRNADLDRAAEAAQGWRDLGDDEESAQLVDRIERAQGRDGADAEAFTEVIGFTRTLVNMDGRDLSPLQRLCRLGVRRFPESANFPRCLATVAHENRDVGRTTGWYAEAVRLAPADEALAEEALTRIAGLLTWRHATPSNTAQGRVVARQLLEILEEFGRRWPEQSTPQRTAGPLRALGRIELSHGNLAVARERLSASLAAIESGETHALLGLVLERTGQSGEAAEHYRRALDASISGGSDANLERALVLERLGDVHRRSGEAEQAEQRYREAVEVLDELVQSSEQLLEHYGPNPMTEATLSDSLARRGIVKSRLGDHEAADSDFSAALTARPSSHVPYAAILSHLVVGHPNLELGQSVLERAQQVPLERKVHLALRVQAVAARTGAEPGEAVATLLGEVRGNSWAARLASFGLGQLDYEALLAAASTPSERAQAQFHQGARLLGSGDVEGAQALFRLVLESGLVHLDEHLMAFELLTPSPASASTES